MAEDGDAPSVSTLQRITPNIVQKRAQQFERSVIAQNDTATEINTQENVKPSAIRREQISPNPRAREGVGLFPLQTGSQKSQIRRGPLKNSIRPNNIDIPSGNVKPQITSPKPRLHFLTNLGATCDRVPVERQAPGDQAGGSEHKVSNFIAQKTKLFESESETASNATGLGKHRQPAKFSMSRHVETPVPLVLQHKPLRMTESSSPTYPCLEVDTTHVDRPAAAAVGGSNISNSDTQQEGPHTVKDLSLLFTNNLSKPTSNSANDVSDPSLQLISREEDLSCLYAVVNKPSSRKPVNQDPVYANTNKIYQRNPTQSNQSDQSTVATGSSTPSTKSPPPLKPPRTFAHDAYMFRRGGSKSNQKLTSLSEAPENPYEEINPDMKPPPLKPVTCSLGQYAEISEISEASLKTSPRLHKEKYRRRFACAYEEINDCRADFRELPVSKEYEDISCGFLGENLQDAGGKSSSKISQRRPASAKRPSSKPPPPPRPPQSSVSAPSGEQDEYKTVEMLDSDEIFDNPTYVEQQDCTPLKTSVSSDGKLRRSKSDQYLYGIVPDVHSHYKEPIDCVEDQMKPTITEHGVVLDTSGYAVPEGTPAHSALCKQLSSQCSTLGRRSSAQRKPVSPTEKLKPLQCYERVKRAYSVLRPRKLQEKLTTMEVVIEDEDSDTDMDNEQHRNRIAHVSSTREKYGYLTQLHRKSRTSQLFDYALIVTLEFNSETNENETRVLFHYPTQPEDDIRRISNFCFPDVSTWKRLPYEESEAFFFVLTNETGHRQYGHCHRIVPNGQYQPEVLCVVSPFGEFSFYNQLLRAAEGMRLLSLDHAKDLFKSAYGQPMPQPGEEAWIHAPGTGNRKDSVILSWSRANKLDDVSFDLLLSKLSLDILLKVFGSILLERRLIFIANTLSTLTSCVHALVSLMYPFEWLFTFIPVLPVTMLDICCAPTPFIIGVLSEMQAKLKLLPMAQVLIVDLEKNVIIQHVGDERGIIPRKLQKALFASIRDDSEAAGSSFSLCADVPLAPANRNMIVFEAFLRMFVETIGHYTDFIVTQQDGQHLFEKECFVKAVSSKSIRMFLEWFTQTQHFEDFLNHRMEEDHRDSFFEIRVEEYRNEMEEMHAPVSHNVKSVGKKMINFFVESGDKIKKAFRRNVFI